MYLRNRALALAIASNFVVATLHSQSNSNGEMSPQKGRANKANADSAVLVPGQTHSDSLASGGKGPVMVVLPSGRFAMGSPKDEAGREENEGPVHDVSVRSFVLGKYPVTRGEFSRFASATGYKTDAEKDTPFPFSRPNLGLRSLALPIRAVARAAGKPAPVGAIRATSRAMMSRWCA
jgi:formylglycine-generating enzyme required for sulfatase activity